MNDNTPITNGMEKLLHPTLYDGCNYLFMLGLDLIRVSKGGHWHTGSPVNAQYQWGDLELDVKW